MDYFTTHGYFTGCDCPSKWTIGGSATVTLTPEFDLSYHFDGPQDAVGVHFGIHQTTGRLTQTSGKRPILCDFFFQFVQSSV